MISSEKCSLVTAYQVLTTKTSALRGSMTRSFLSLQDATMRDPSQFHETLSGMSGKSISARTSHVPQFQINTLLSEPRRQESQVNNRQHNC